MNTVQIDIVSDVACPWCYIGKKNLDKALQEIGQEKVMINWHPYQLDPSIPMEGYDRKVYYDQKFGSSERSKQLHERVVEFGKNAGINFQFDAIPRVVNTLLLHKLLHVAGQEGFEAALEERLFKAMFTDGTDLSNKTELYAIMLEYGWDEQKTDAILEDDSLGYYIKQEIKHFQDLGVTGVPFFIFNNKYGFSGAQPIEVFVETIQKIWNETQPAQPVSPEAEACSIDGENCL